MDYTKMPYWHIGLLVCVFYGIFVIQPQWYWYAVWFCMHFIIVTFGIHFTFHRLISHKAFRTSTLIERLGTIVGCLAMSGSSIGWSGVHIHHHRYSDTELDPHPASRGWRNVFGFIDHSKVSNRSFVPLRWYMNDQFHSTVDKYYFEIIFAWWLFCFWVFGIEGLFFLGLMPTSTSGLATLGSNNIVHKNDKPVNNLLAWLLIFGDAAHADHHDEPRKRYLTRYIDPVGFMVKHLQIDK